MATLKDFKEFKPIINELERMHDKLEHNTLMKERKHIFYKFYRLSENTESMIERQSIWKEYQRIIKKVDAQISYLREKIK